MASQPYEWTSAKIEERLVSFKDWLAKAGAELLASTNEWEVLRFRDGDTTSIVYKNAKGRATFTGTALDAWNAYKTGAKWRCAVRRTKREHKNARDRSMVTIRKRDGDLCFFCAQLVAEDEESVEHLVDLTYGGPNHISNKFLAHIDCNNAAVGLSAPEKIARYAAARMPKEVRTHRVLPRAPAPTDETTPPWN